MLMTVTTKIMGKGIFIKKKLIEAISKFAKQTI